MGEKPNSHHDRVWHSGASLSPIPTTQGSSNGQDDGTGTANEGSQKPPVQSTDRPCVWERLSLGSDAGEYLLQTSSFLQSCQSSDQACLDLLIKREAQDAADCEAQLAMELRWEERELKREEWELRQEEREVQESKERKEVEDKKMKISLAQTLMSSGYPEIEAVAKRKLPKTLHTL